jgi:hypothetical protein
MLLVLYLEYLERMRLWHAKDPTAPQCYSYEQFLALHKDLCDWDDVTTKDVFLDPENR